MKNKMSVSPYKSFLALSGLSLSIVLVLSLFQYLIAWIEAFLEWGIPSKGWVIFLYALGILFLSLLELRLLTPTFGKGNVASLHVLLDKGEKVPFLKGLSSVFLCCLISFLIGVPLGGEGPSVFIGALLGEGLFLWTRDRKQIYDVIAIGAATGFASAFLNPLSGFFYLVEHHKKERLPLFLLLKEAYVLLLSYFGMVLVRFLEGREDIFHYNLFRSTLLPMSGYEHNLLFLIIPFLAFAFALLFKHAVLAMRNTYKPDERKVFVLSTLFALVFVLSLKFMGHANLLGIGTNLIHEMPSLTIEDAFLFLFLRFVFTVFAFDSFYAGGQVLPTLAVGYLFGLLLSSLLAKPVGLDEQEQTLFSLVTMLAFYASVSDSYWTSLALSFSFGPFQVMVLPALFAILVVYLLDRYLFDTKSLSEMIVEYDRKVNESEPRLVY